MRKYLVSDNLLAHQFMTHVYKIALQSARRLIVCALFASFHAVGQTTVPPAQWGVNLNLTTPVGANPVALSLHESANRIYVVNNGSNSVSVLDRLTGVATEPNIPVGQGPVDIALNSALNRLYVANAGSNDLTVIDLTSGTRMAVALGFSPDRVLANPTSGTVYAFGTGRPQLAAINGTTLTKVDLDAGGDVISGVVNPVTNKVFFSICCDKVAQFIGSGSAPDLITGITNGTSMAMAVDTVRNKVYTAGLSGQGTSIDGTTLAFTPLDFGFNGNQIRSMAVEESTGRLFFLPAGAFNPLTGAIYAFTNGGNSNFYEGTMAVDSTRQLAYVTAPGNALVSSAVGILPAQTGNELPLNVHGFLTNTSGAFRKLGAIVADPGRNKAYVVDSTNNAMHVLGIERVFSTLVIDRSPNPSLVGESVMVTARVLGNTPEGRVRFKVDGNLVPGCENAVLVSGIANCTLSGLERGLRTISVDYFGDTNNRPTSLMVPQTVNNVTQSISFGPVPTPSPVWAPGGVTVNLTALTSSGLPLTFHISNGTCNIVSPSASTVSLRFANAGICVIRALQSGDATYASVDASLAVTVLRAPQSIPATSIPTQPSNGGYVMPAIFSSSGYGVSFDINTPQICAKRATASNYIIDFLDIAGTCSITLSEGGNINFLPADPVTVSFEVFSAPPRSLSIVTMFPASAFPGEAVFLSFSHTILQGAVVRLGTIDATVISNSNGVIQFLVPTSAPAGAAQVVVERLGAIATTPFVVKRHAEAPRISQVIAGVASAAIFFSPPDVQGSSPALAYRADCGAYSAVGTGSPILVTGLINDSSYSCTVTAQSELGDGPPSSPSATVFPSASVPLVYLGAYSRKFHAGTIYDLPLSSIHRSIEPRVAQGQSHQIVFKFNRPVDTHGLVSVTSGTPTASGIGYALFIELSNVADTAISAISVNGVNGDSKEHHIEVGFLTGDVNASNTVDGTDCSAIKRMTGQLVNSENFLFDITVSGSISGADISVCKRRVSRRLP